jgi:hypothetical protein
MKSVVTFIINDTNIGTNTEEHLHAFEEVTYDTHMNWCPSRFTTNVELLGKMLQQQMCSLFMSIHECKMYRSISLESLQHFVFIVSQRNEMHTDEIASMERRVMQR